MNRFAIAAAVLAFGLQLPLHAQERLPDIAVSAAGLDLTSPHGQALLDQRIAGAAKRACPSADGTRDLRQIRQAKHCQATKIAEVQSARATLLARANTPRATAIASVR